MKTLKLIKRYRQLLEQDEIEEVDVDVDVEADATDVEDIPPEPEGITSEGEIYIAKLLTNAFIWPPSRKDINIANQILQEFGETDPRKVIESIERLLEFTDESLEQELDDLDAH
tara:strand:- start:266 stop:607 length:342 start_codon:yes stop_codon:yes gene_type:complete